MQFYNSINQHQVFWLKAKQCGSTATLTQILPPRHLPGERNHLKYSSLLKHDTNEIMMQRNDASALALYGNHCRFVDGQRANGFDGDFFVIANISQSYHMAIVKCEVYPEFY